MTLRFTGKLRVPSGKLTATPQPIVATDPNFADVKMLLHFEGADEGTVFTDSSSIGATPTRGGSALPVTDTAQAKFGSTAGRFGTTSQTTRLNFSSNAAYVVGTNDFTMECWYYRPTAGASDFAMLMSNTDDNVDPGPHMRITTGNRLNAFFGLGTSPSGNVTGTIPIPLDQWSHIAIAYTRSDTTLRLFVDGVLDTSSSVSTTGNNDTLHIGQTYGDETNSFDTLPGWVDEARFTNGTARYTTTFSVPTAAFPDS